MLKMGHSSVTTTEIYAEFNLGLTKLSEDKYFRTSSNLKILSLTI